MEDLLKLSDAALVSGEDIDAVIAEAEADHRRASYNESVSPVSSQTSEDTEATFKPTRSQSEGKTEEGTRPWNFSLGRFSKRISRRGGKDLRTSSDINAPTKRPPVALELDTEDDATDCGYIENGYTTPSTPSTPMEDLVREHDLTQCSEEGDAEWKDIHQFLNTVVADSTVAADANDTDSYDPSEVPGVAGQQQALDSRYSPNFQAAVMRRGSRRTSLI